MKPFYGRGRTYKLVPPPVSTISSSNLDTDVSSSLSSVTALGRQQTHSLIQACGVHKRSGTGGGNDSKINKDKKGKLSGGGATHYSTLSKHNSTSDI